MGNAQHETLFSRDDREETFFQEGCWILELLNDPADPDVSIVRARVAPGETTRWHRLAGTTERYLIVAGRGEAWVGDQPLQHVEPGDVVLIPAMARQRIHNPGPEELVFLAICTPRFRPQNYEDIPGDES